MLRKKKTRSTGLLHIRIGRCGVVVEQRSVCHECAEFRQNCCRINGVAKGCQGGKGCPIYRPVPSAPPVPMDGLPSSTPEHAADSTAPHWRQSLAPWLTMRHGEAIASQGR